MQDFDDPGCGNHAVSNTKRLLEGNSLVVGARFTLLLWILLQSPIDSVRCDRDRVAVRGIEPDGCQLSFSGFHPFDPPVHARFSRSARISASGLPGSEARRSSSSSVMGGSSLPQTSGKK